MVETTDPARTLVAWCPDWPLTAAGMTPELPAAVVVADRVVVCSAGARSEGVRRGMHRREAQRRCPGLVVLPDDPRRDAMAFERVVAEVERFTPQVEVVRPGVCAFRSERAARYLDRTLSPGRGRADGADGAGGTDDAFGVDVALAEQVADVVGHGCRVGVADGLFAAGLAARRGVVVPAGGTREFLAPWPVTALERPELVDLLVRLGLSTLGDFAALPAGDVNARFGPDGARAHRLARGLDERPLVLRHPPPDLVVSTELDPPVDRVDQAAFAVKALADELHERLAAHGLTCTRIAIDAETEHGERLRRLWRQDGTLVSSVVAERMRWQLDGWINGTGVDSERPTGGLILLRLAADEVAPGDGHQLDLWGATDEAGERVTRAIARVQGMLGVEAVTTPVLGGGRAPADQVSWVVWGEPREPRRDLALPWPGQLPTPAPATVHFEPSPTEVTDAQSRPVTVDGRCVISAAPAWLTGPGGRRRVVSWAGPWPVDERWWDRRRRYARLQVVTQDGAALLLVLESGRWWVEAEYD